MTDQLALLPIDAEAPEAALADPRREGSLSSPKPAGLKAWHAPQFIVSQVSDTQFSSDPPTSDGTPVSQLS